MVFIQSKALKIMNLNLTTLFEEVSPADGGGFHAYIAEIPGVISQGETLQEAK